MLNVNNALYYVHTGVQEEADETLEEDVDIQVLWNLEEKKFVLNFTLNQGSHKCMITLHIYAVFV